MISEKMKPLVQNNSAIRAMFEEGTKMKAIYGEDNVYDFSLGNPNVPAPKEVKEAIFDILEHEDPVKVGRQGLSSTWLTPISPSLGSGILSSHIQLVSHRLMLYFDVSKKVGNILYPDFFHHIFQCEFVHSYFLLVRHS